MWGWCTLSLCSMLRIEDMQTTFHSFIILLHSTFNKFPIPFSFISLFEEPTHNSYVLRCIPTRNVCHVCHTNAKKIIWRTKHEKEKTISRKQLNSNLFGFSLTPIIISLHTHIHKHSYSAFVIICMSLFYSSCAFFSFFCVKYSNYRTASLSMCTCWIIQLKALVIEEKRNSTEFSTFISRCTVLIYTF